VACVDFSPDGQSPATGSVDGAVKLRDVESGAELRSFEAGTEPVGAAAFSPEGGWIAIGDKEFSGPAVILDAESPGKVRSIKTQEPGQITCSLAFSPNSALLASPHIPASPPPSSPADRRCT